ncbi:MAG: hypothetical protein PHP54_01980 [Clostridia bacterium]|nr:hypothetical protein [Clostridia bacterium]
MKKKLVIKSIVLILLLVVLFNINSWLNANNLKSNTTTPSGTTSSNNVRDIFYTTQRQVETFMIYLSNEKYEEAFNMIDDNCKMNNFNNNIEKFKKVILERYFNPDKAERKYTISSENTNARYRYNDIYAYYTVDVYSPEVAGSDYYNPSNEGKNYNFNESFYQQRAIKIDVMDIKPYDFKLIVQFKEY